MYKTLPHLVLSPMSEMLLWVISLLTEPASQDKI